MVNLLSKFSSLFSLNKLLIQYSQCIILMKSIEKNTCLFFYMFLFRLYY